MKAGEDAATAMQRGRSLNAQHSNPLQLPNNFGCWLTLSQKAQPEIKLIRGYRFVTMPTTGI